MASSIIPKSYSNVIYLQPSFSIMQDDFSSLRHLPYVKLALDFPWERVFAPIEQEYVKSRFERYRNKKNPKCLNINHEELLAYLPQNVSIQLEKSTKGRKGINFYALFKSFLLTPLLYVEVMVSSVHLQVAGNSDFRNVCGFTQIPSLKTFERFD
ncbi:MAG: transposase family protein [Neobacillus sp.]|nr:transposase family protein [Neobacillus sp.]